MKPLAIKFAQTSRALYFKAVAPWFEGLGEGVIINPKGRCLISYAPGAIEYVCRRMGKTGWEPRAVGAMIPEIQKNFNNHMMYWESVELVRQVIARGYVVDYIFRVFPRSPRRLKTYDVFIDEWNDLPEWATINPHARKLFYATGMEWSYWNHAELTRIHWLVQRRGVGVPPSRQCPPILSHEHADLISSYGNEFIQRTFGPAHQPKIRRVNPGSLADRVDLAGKNWPEARNTFLWFAGYGWLPRGLDLTIEVFLKKPHLKLIVAGGPKGSDRYHEDPFFQRIYGTELRRAKNIEFHGFVDIQGELFHNLASRSCAVITPTALDSWSGSVAQAMHHGLIPITTPAAGLDLPQSFLMLPEDNDSRLMDCLADRCEELASMPERGTRAPQAHRLGTRPDP